MAFEDLTLVPIQTKMIDPALLTPSEEQWLDAYHRKVRILVAKASRLDASCVCCLLDEAYNVRILCYNAIVQTRWAFFHCGVCMCGRTNAQ